MEARDAQGEGARAGAASADPAATQGPAPGTEAGARGGRAAAMFRPPEPLHLHKALSVQTFAVDRTTAGIRHHQRSSSSGGLTTLQSASSPASVWIDNREYVKRVRQNDSAVARSFRRVCRVCPLLALGVLALHAISCGFLFCVHVPDPVPDFTMWWRSDVIGYGVANAKTKMWSPARDEVPARGEFVARNVMQLIFRPVPQNVPESPGATAEDAADLRAAADTAELRTDGLNAAGALARSLERPPNLIPDVLHQTYRSKAVPSNVRSMMDSWRRLNPEFSFRFYDDAACLAFVRREFPEYLNAYLTLSKDVERADFFRYMVVLRLGGYYADVDCECKQPIAGLARPTDTLIVGWEGDFDTERDAEERRFVRQRQVLQWVFAAAPGHPALRDACDRIAERARMLFSNDTNRDTLQKTGPGLFTDVVMNAAQQHPSSEHNPWGVRFLPRVSFGVHPKGLDGVLPNSPDVIVQHHYVGSWKWRAWPFQFGSSPAPPPPAPSNATSPSRSRRLEFAVVSVHWEPSFDAYVFPAGSPDAPPGSFTALASRWLTQYGRWHLEASTPPRGIGIADPVVGALERNGGDFVAVTPGLGFVALAAAARGKRVRALVSAEPSPVTQLFERAVERNGFAHDGLVSVFRARGDDASTASQVLGTNRSRTGASVVYLGAVDAVHAGGWATWGVEATLRLAGADRPAAVVLEHQPGRSEAWAAGGASALFSRLASLGYTEIAHTGAVCTEQWMNTTVGSMGRRPFLDSSAKSSVLPFLSTDGTPALLEVPKWCRTNVTSVGRVAMLGRDAEPETFLLTFG